MLGGGGGYHLEPFEWRIFVREKRKGEKLEKRGNKSRLKFKLMQIGKFRGKYVKLYCIMPYFQQWVQISTLLSTIFECFYFSYGSSGKLFIINNLLEFKLK